MSKRKSRLQRAILVHNRGAGSGAHSADDLVAMLRNAGYAATVVDAKDKAALGKLSRARGTVFVAGGDGTVQRTARQLVGTRKTIAVLPLGTANNIARSLGIEGDPAEVLRGLERGRRIPVDVGLAKGPWGKRVFIEGVGAGLFAEVMAALDSGRAPKRRPGAHKNGVTRFSAGEAHLERALQALSEALPRYRAKASEVSVDGKKIRGRFLLLAAMNMRYVGPNLLLGPDVDLADGKLDFVMLGEAQRGEFADYLAHRLDGGHDAPALTTVRGKRLRFAWAGATLHIDDKPVAARGGGKSGPAIVEIRAKPAALHFLVPPRKRARRTA